MYYEHDHTVKNDLISRLGRKLFWQNEQYKLDADQWKTIIVAVVIIVTILGFVTYKIKR
jgi:hypothetical protein